MRKWVYISRSSYLRLLDVRIIDKYYHTWYTWLLKSMCVHAHNLHACLGAHVHAGNHGGQRRTLGVIPQSLPIFLVLFLRYGLALTQLSGIAGQWLLGCAQPSFLITGITNTPCQPSLFIWVLGIKFSGCWPISWASFKSFLMGFRGFEIQTFHLVKPWSSVSLTAIFKHQMDTSRVWNQWGLNRKSLSS